MWTIYKAFFLRHPFHKGPGKRFLNNPFPFSSVTSANSIIVTFRQIGMVAVWLYIQGFAFNNILLYTYGMLRLKYWDFSNMIKEEKKMKSTDKKHKLNWTRPPPPKKKYFIMNEQR